MKDIDPIIIEDPIVEELAAAEPSAAVEEPKNVSAENSDEVKDETPTLKEVIQQQATEDEAPQSSNFTLRKILGGDILYTSAVRSQIWLLLLITFFLVIYISNRYSCQQSLIKIDKLKNELKDAKFRALSSNSQLTEKSRESNVLEMLKNNKDSLLHHADQAPYIINVPKK